MTFSNRSLFAATSLLAAGLASVACSSEDDASSGENVPAFVGPLPNAPAGASVPSGAAPDPNGSAVDPAPSGNPGNAGEGLDPAAPIDPSDDGTQGGGTQGAGGSGGVDSSPQSPPAAGGTSMVPESEPPTGAGGSEMSPIDMDPADMDPADMDPPPAAPPDPEPQLPEPPGNAFFFDDFEAGAPGTEPAAWTNWINYTTDTNNVATAQQFALLDDSDAFTGSQSVHFHTEGATQPAMLTRPVPAGVSSVYIRAYVKTRIQVGGVQPDAVSNHETLIGLRATPGDGNDEIRFGGAKGALGFNMVGPGRNDAVAPLAQQWGSGPGMTPNVWHCVEIAYLNQGNPTATASLDGTVVRTVDAPGDWHIPVAAQWLNGLFNEVFIGWQSFSPQPANDVWMDDVVLSSSPVGCD